MRPFTVVDVPQRSPEWLQARCGRLCSTDAADLLAKIKSGEAAARRDLRMRLCLERLTGTPTDDGFINNDMKRGIELEPDAFAAYEGATGSLVTRVGFIAHNDLLMGYSPDGILGDCDGLLELKVPRSATHLRYLRNGTLPSEHAAQVMHALYVTGARFCDFASYDPRFPESMRLFRVRVERNEDLIAGYGVAARTFLAEVDRELEVIRTLNNLPETLKQAAVVV